MLRLPPFRLVRPSTPQEAARALRDDPEAMVVAGGTDLYPNMKRRQQEPRRVISLAGLGELARIESAADGAVRVGALVTLTALESSTLVRERHPWVAKAASLISTPLLRNMGTVGGNLCLDTRCNYYDQTHEWRRGISFCMKKEGDTCWVAPGSPRCWAVSSSDLAPVLCALGAAVTLVGPDAVRTVQVAELYQDDGIRYLAKRRDEVITHLTLPAPGPYRAAYFKVRRRGSFDFPVLGVGAWARFEGDHVAAARIVLGGVGSCPQEVEKAGAALIGGALTDERIAAAATAAAHPARPLDNTDFVMGWRKKVVPVFVRRALAALRDGRPGGAADALDGVGPTGSVLPTA